MKKIDPENWEGREMFAQFSAMECPFFSVTTRYDATALLEKAKKMDVSFSSVCLFAVSKALNEVEAFRYRVLEGGDIVLYDKIDTVCLAMREDRAITAVRVPFQTDYVAFEEARRQEEAKTLALPEPYFYRGYERDVFFISIVPWLAFTGMTHPVSLGSRYDSSVRMTLGKYESSDGRATMPVDIHSHHGFVDGYRHSLFFEAMGRSAQNI